MATLSMMNRDRIRPLFFNIDWVLVFSVLAVVFFGLVTMKSFDGVGSSDYFFNRQILWVGIGLAVFLVAFLIDWSFLKTNSVFLIVLFLAMLAMLAFLFIGGSSIRGAASWYQVYSAQIEPVELMKPVLVLLLAKYFSRRHVALDNFFYIAISVVYVAIPAMLVMMQPDLGSASVLILIWFGMALIAGIRFRHVIMLTLVGSLIAVFAWSFVLFPYQKERIISFLDPTSDALGSGYHALQSVIAIGSGELFGKGIGYGTQSRLAFLPEHETDFIFAAFAEEWGFLGVLILFFFFGVILWRIFRAALIAESNFEKFYAIGFAILLFFQAAIHISMNAGVFPVTGLGMPFLSYGGSSLVSFLFGLGILSSLTARHRGVSISSASRYSDGVVGA
jgi:rod shape determining protein RodA